MWYAIAHSLLAFLFHNLTQPPHSPIFWFINSWHQKIKSYKASMQRAWDDVKYKDAGEHRMCHQSPPCKWTNLLEISSGDRATLSRGSLEDAAQQTTAHLHCARGVRWGGQIYYKIVQYCLRCTAATCLGSPCITKPVRLEVRGMRNKRVSYGIYSQYFLSYEEKIRVNDKQHKT